ncbi:hypothetical protein, partial [Arthrobacter sp. Soil782]|uniref:hypothetical protein n=1 Tax=Arthrobacter sp. Soil782 TaxID=1736410 RepID=UPI001F24A3C2
MHLIGTLSAISALPAEELRNDDVVDRQFGASTWRDPVFEAVGILSPSCYLETASATSCSNSSRV